MKVTKEKVMSVIKPALNVIVIVSLVATAFQLGSLYQSSKQSETKIENPYAHAFSPEEISIAVNESNELIMIERATGDVTKSQDLLNLALDISAATGKSVESVSNALAKAYEGNTGALSRLGIGLSAAEIKALGLDGTMEQLATTFGGAATTQANTLEGQIARLKVGFDEAKEAVGTQLLPIVKGFIDYLVNTLIPKMQEAKEKAIDPIIKAFKDNEETLRSLWSFVKTYLVPIFEKTLVNAIVNVGKTIAGIITIVSVVTREVKKIANSVIDVINKIIIGYNKIPFLPDIGLIPNIPLTQEAMTGSVKTSSLPFGGASVGGDFSSSVDLLTYSSTPKFCVRSSSTYKQHT